MMTSKTTVSRIAMGLLASACMTQTAFAQSADAPDDDVPMISAAEALAIDATLYAESFGVGFEEAARRLSIMNGDISGIDEIEGGEGEDLASSFFDNGQDFALVVRSKAKKKPSKRKLKVKTKSSRAMNALEAIPDTPASPLGRKMGLTGRQMKMAGGLIGKTLDLDVDVRGNAKVTVKELSKKADASANALSSLSGLDSVFVDEVALELVVVMTEEPDATAQRRIEDLGVPYRIDVIPNGFEKVAVRGGQLLYNSPGASSRGCTSGFTAIKGFTVGMITAGHCGSKYFMADGSNRVEVNVTSPDFDDGRTADVQFMEGSPAFAPQFYFDNSGYVRGVNSVARTANFTSGDATSATGSTVRAGSYICHIGQDFFGSTYSVQSCGEVISKTFNLNTNDFTTGNLGVIRSLRNGVRGTSGTETNGTLKCFPGDSGGSVFANNTAYGITSACAMWSPRSTNPATRALYLVFTTIDGIESRGLSIATQ